MSHTSCLMLSVSSLKTGIRAPQESCHPQPTREDLFFLPIEQPLNRQCVLYPAMALDIQLSTVSSHVNCKSHLEEPGVCNLGNNPKLKTISIFLCSGSLHPHARSSVTIFLHKLLLPLARCPFLLFQARKVLSLWAERGLIYQLTDCHLVWHLIFYTISLEGIRHIQS